MMLILKFLIVFVVTWVLSDFLDVDEVSPVVIVGVAILITVFVSIFQLGVFCSGRRRNTADRTRKPARVECKYNWKEMRMLACMIALIL